MGSGARVAWRRAGWELGGWELGGWEPGGLGGGWALGGPGGLGRMGWACPAGRAETVVAGAVVAGLGYRRFILIRSASWCP